MTTCEGASEGLEESERGEREENKKKGKGEVGG